VDSVEVTPEVVGSRSQRSARKGRRLDATFPAGSVERGTLKESFRMEGQGIESVATDSVAALVS
jgi:hypothetical protein